ncbi:MAG: endopeptidase La [Deltaproteobacteria bacterium]|nr:endopeptidase La [Deltaproteobacteria bacterium]
MNKSDLTQLPSTLSLLPLRSKSLFPLMASSLYVGRIKSISSVEYAWKNSGYLICSSLKDDSIDEPSDDDIFSIGTLVHIVQLFALRNATFKVLVTCIGRVRITGFDKNDDSLTLVDYELLDDSETENESVSDLLSTARKSFEHYIRISQNLPHELIATAAQITKTGQFADLIISNLVTRLSTKTLQMVLEELNPEKRLEMVLNLLEEEMDLLGNENKIRHKLKSRKINLPQSVETLPPLKTDNSTPDDSDFNDELANLEKSISERELSEEAREKALRELHRLRQMAPMSAEANVSRSYIDWILSIPWGEYSPVVFDIKKSQEILDRDHHGMEQPKERILEHLAVTALTGETSGPVLCFAGPPGVGKTSLAKSVAQACNRSFVRISLGGVKDESEIRGHRRTYVGSMPGKIIHAMRRAKTCNPLILLDEIDKLSSDVRGDPASAMLEVLDPEQNHTFVDHYIDLDYDLSGVLFITTANSIENIPWALRDRMEIIELDAYTEWEKVSIATDHLIPRQLKKNGLNAEYTSFSENAIRTIINHYTKEAGVRSLEREIASVLRKIAVEVVGQKRDRNKPLKISAPQIEGFLGHHKFQFGKGENQSMIGVVNGLAVTSMGGDLLLAEASVIPGKGQLVLTGKLGEVMRESAQTGLSWVRSQMGKLRLNVEFFDTVDIHIHFPEGAVPKDGPSAGVTIITAIISSILKVPVFMDIAMTGEITLRGRVLKIGGLKEKLIAAHRSGMKKVIIPEANKVDLSDVPVRILNSMDIITVSEVGEVLDNALFWEGKPSIVFSRMDDNNSK